MKSESSAGCTAQAGVSSVQGQLYCACRACAHLHCCLLLYYHHLCISHHICLSVIAQPPAAQPQHVTCSPPTCVPCWASLVLLLPLLLEALQREAAGAGSSRGGAGALHWRAQLPAQQNGQLTCRASITSLRCACARCSFQDLSAPGSRAGRALQHACVASAHAWALPRCGCL